MGTKRLRIWHYYSPPTAEGAWIRLRVGEEWLSVHEGGPNEEGYWYETVSYRIADGRLEREWESTALDCDGRLDRSGSDVALIHGHRLAMEPHRFAAEGHAPPDGLAIVWGEHEQSQRDYNAEAAGY